jgi:dethiobiotin synthetase
MQPNRPRQLIGVLGTHTEVGKTYVLAQWLAMLRAQGYTVTARKPVQSFGVNDETTDAKQLAAATGESPAEICPSHRSYPLAYAPPMAADVLQRPGIRLAELIADLNWPKTYDVGAVETVGGPRSPIAHDGDSVELLLRLQPDRVLLVADAGLGTLNAVRLSLTAAAPLRCVVVLNRYQADNELHRLNREWLRRDGIEGIVNLSELTSLLLKGVALSKVVGSLFST